MSNILFINTSFSSEKEKYGELFPPLGLLTIATPLIKAGYEIFLIDPQIEDNYLELIKQALDRKPLFVGMTTILGANIKNALTISKFIKNMSPKTTIIWGGPLATSVPEICFREAPVDYIAMGMGEEIVVQIAKTIESGGDLKTLSHLSYRSEDAFIIKDIYRFGSNNINHIASPSLDLWAKGIQKSGFIPVMSSRGCPRNCSFCYNNAFTGRRKWFSHSGDFVINELDYWTSHFKIYNVEFLDDNFLVDTKRAVYILEELKKREYIVDRLVGHLNEFKPEILNLIFRYIKKICFSIESASPKIQKLLNKPIDLNKALELSSYLMDKGIERITTIFMMGLPTETDDDIKQNIDMALKMRNISERIAIPAFIYNPQPKDDIMPNFDFFKKIRFSIENLSGMDMAPNRSQKILSEVRPWMTEEDINFYLDLIMVWFYHFHYEVRASQDIDIEGIYNRNKRVANLFKDVPIPT